MHRMLRLTRDAERTYAEIVTLLENAGFRKRGECPSPLGQGQAWEVYLRETEVLILAMSARGGWCLYGAIDAGIHDLAGLKNSLAVWPVGWPLVRRLGLAALPGPTVANEEDLP